MYMQRTVPKSENSDQSPPRVSETSSAMQQYSDTATVSENQLSGLKNKENHTIITASF